MSKITNQNLKDQIKKVKYLKTQFEDAIKNNNNPEKWLNLWLAEDKKLNSLQDLYYFK